jgi:inner membrane protein
MLGKFMDIVTHAVLGALVAQSISPVRHRRLAALVGAGAALLPDLDVFIQSSSHPLLVLEYHRHFTHSLLFAPLAALLATYLLAPLLRESLSRPRLFALILLAYVSACLLDACTSYGTYLLWPLLNKPVALSLIAVVDPLFSVLLLVGLVQAWRHYSASAARWGLLMGLAYLFIGWSQQERALAQAEIWVAESGHKFIQLEAKPTLGNLLLWRILGVTEAGDLRVSALYLGWHPRLYPGESRPLLVLDELNLSDSSSALRELRRFEQLDGPLLVRHSEDPWFIGDGRYALLPHRIDPLWGLALSPTQPNALPIFESRRQMRPQDRQLFMNMLLGRELNDE